jgi:hypothetical protein
MALHMVGTSHDKEGLKNEKKLQHPLNKKWRQAIGSLFQLSTKNASSLAWPLVIQDDDGEQVRQSCSHFMFEEGTRNKKVVKKALFYQD